MSRSLVLAMVFGLFLGSFGSVRAQSRTPDVAGERFSFQVTDKGVMRFDSRTGEVSQCVVGASGVICRAAPDERAVFESEIARLESENAVLKKALADRGLAALPPVPPAPIPPETADKSSGPGTGSQSETARGRIMERIDTAWRNLVAMMARLKSALQ